METLTQIIQSELFQILWPLASAYVGGTLTPALCRRAVLPLLSWLAGSLPEPVELGGERPPLVARERQAVQRSERPRRRSRRALS